MTLPPGWTGPALQESLRALGVNDGDTVVVYDDGQAPGSVTVPHDDLYDGARRVLTMEQAAHTGEFSVLLDARAPERYCGEVEPIDPVAGHIPGAANLPSPTVLDEDGRFLPAEKLREVFTRLGVAAGDDDPVAGAYCGSGVSAAVLVAVADSVGINLALFPGSWSQWSQDLVDNPGSSTGLN